MTHKTFIPALRRISVLALAALAIMALMACPGKHKNYDDDDEEDETEVTGALQIDDEFLNSFDPNVPFEQTGHSRPFRIHPREDMTISAEAGAFERDVNIRVTDLSTEKMIELDKMFEGTTTTMLFAYDLDAGLPTDSVIPGKYTVSIDLEKHGIPEELYPYFVMYRVAGDGSLQPLNVKIKGHTATYQASQNSITLDNVDATDLTVLAKYGNISQVGETTVKATGLAEHEVDHVLLGKWDGEPAPDAAEVGAVRWVAVAELDAEMASAPERFTPWFRRLWAELRARGLR